MTQETRRDLRFPMLALGVAAAALALAVSSLQTAPFLGGIWPNGVVLALLLGATGVTELLGVIFPRSIFSVSMSFPLGIAVGLYFGPSYAALSAVFMVAPLLLLPAARKWDKMVFNGGQLALTFTTAAFLYERLARGPLIHAHIQNLPVVDVVVAAVLAVLVGVAINALLVVLGAAVLYGKRWDRTLVEVMAPAIPSQLALGFVGVLMAYVAAAIGPSGLLLFVVPLLVARQTYERTVQLGVAYADTISSLVAALEAKDVYTKGHSVRVARYACATARTLGMAEPKVERLEWAALLHDIGKVGISRQVLSKDGRLTADEYTEIKRHPEIGARILAVVPYLSDLVPAIEAHHERLDGSGYGHGASGVEIPLEARILAVADAYDAMTSTRPYRVAMPHDEAVGELQRGRGTQFDDTVVDAFLAAAADVSLFDEEAAS